MSGYRIPTEAGIHVIKDEDWDEHGWTSVPNAILRHPDLSWEAKGAFAWLSSHSQTFTLRADDLANAGTKGRNHARDMLRELEKHGWLTRHRHRNGHTGCYDVHVYSLHPMPVPPEKRTYSESTATRRPFPLVRPATDSAGAGGPGAGQPVPGSSGDFQETNLGDQESKSFSSDESLEVYTHARNEDHLDLVEAGFETDEEVLETLALGQRVVDQDPDLFGGDQLPVSNGKIKKPAQRDVEFDAFWAAYPRKEGGKLEARKAWDRAIKKVTVDQLMAAVAVLAEYKIREYPDPGERKKLTALPTTWLNQGRWDDELRIEDARPRSGNGYHRPRPIRVSATARAVDEVDAAFERVFGSTGQVGLPGGSQ